MKHFQLPQTKEKLDKLLYQYTEYNKATTAEEKCRIGDEMVYNDPIVWIMYKNKAYLGTQHEIANMGALREHCKYHGGICAKRFHFLSKHIKEKYGKDIKNHQEFSSEMSIEDFYKSKLLNEVVQDEGFLSDWQRYEFYKEDGKVAKWQNYITDKTF